VGYAEETMRLGWVCALVFSVTTVAAQETSGSIRGTIVDAANSVVPDAVVTVVGPVSQATKTDASGEFVIAGLAPGTYKLRIQEPGFITRDLEASAETGKETSLGRVVLAIPAPPPCLESAKAPRISEMKLPARDKPSVSGAARGESGDALRNFTVTLLIAGTSKVVATTSTGENGEFHFANVKPGRYDVKASAKKFQLTKVPNLQVRKGHELEVLLTWTEGQICL
jgi:hypothetical protein